MIEKLKKVNLWTLVALGATLYALHYVQSHGWTPEQIVSVAGALSTMLALFGRLVRSDETKPPPTGTVLLPFVAFFGMSLACGCSPAMTPDKQLAAEELYRQQQRDCLRQYDDENDRRACVLHVRDDWFPQDGGAR